MTNLSSTNATNTTSLTEMIMSQSNQNNNLRNSQNLDSHINFKQSVKDQYHQYFQEDIEESAMDNI